MKLKRIFTIVLMCVMSAAMAVAQVHVEAKLDSMVILIGQQTRYVVDVTAPKGSKVVFPTFERSQYIAPGVEVLSQRDEAPAEVDGLMRYSKSYLLTSFDEKAYGISNFKVSVTARLSPTFRLRFLLYKATWRNR